jgi:hypothetical protein
MVGKVRLPTADKVVDDANPKSAFAQQVDHVATDKPGTSGDKHEWLLRPRFYRIRCTCLLYQVEFVPLVREV